MRAARRSVAASWEHFAHEADIGLRATGPDKATVFAMMARAMTAAITDPERIEARDAIAIECAAPSDEVLLVDWLNALVFEMATRKMLFGEFEVGIENGQLHGVARGENVDIERHAPAVEVKGATFTSLELKQNAQGAWSAQCVIDV
jgi:tRNA nucleotidyltransferase (CCA-adding enzyme)